MIDRILFEVTAKVGHERAKGIEEMIELHLQPKPKWMPDAIWHLLIRRLLTLKESHTPK